MLGQPTRRPVLSPRTSHGPDVRRLRESFTRSVAQRQLEHAFRLATQLEALEPTDPRWPHKRGDLLRTFGKSREAAQAYQRAAELYDHHNLSARGDAMRTLTRILGGPSNPLVSEAELHAMVVA